MTHSTHFIYDYMVKDHSDSERGNPVPPHGLLFSTICTIPQPLLHQLRSTGWNEKQLNRSTPWRIDPTTHRTMMSERSYHGATSRSLKWMKAKHVLSIQTTTTTTTTLRRLKQLILLLSIYDGVLSLITITGLVLFANSSNSFVNKHTWVHCDTLETSKLPPAGVVDKGLPGSFVVI